MIRKVQSRNKDASALVGLARREVSRMPRARWETFADDAVGEAVNPRFAEKHKARVLDFDRLCRAIALEIPACQRALNPLADRAAIDEIAGRLRVDEAHWLYVSTARLRNQHVRQPALTASAARKAEQASRLGWTAIADELAEAEKWNSVKKQLDSLSPREKEILFLRAVEEWTFKQIQERLKLRSPAEAQRQYLRALGRLGR